MGLWTEDTVLLQCLSADGPSCQLDCTDVGQPRSIMAAETHGAQFLFVGTSQGWVVYHPLTWESPGRLLHHNTLPSYCFLPDLVPSQRIVSSLLVKQAPGRGYLSELQAGTVIFPELPVEHSKCCVICYLHLADLLMTHAMYLNARKDWLRSHDGTDKCCDCIHLHELAVWNSCME